MTKRQLKQARSVYIDMIHAKEEAVRAHDIRVAAHTKDPCIENQLLMLHAGATASYHGGALEGFITALLLK